MLPITLLSYGFLAGCAGLLFQMLVLVLFGTEATIAVPSTLYLVTAATIEELAKFGFLLQAFRRYGADVSWVSIICFGIGFALVEIALALFLDQTMVAGSGWTALGANAVLHTSTALLFGFGLRRFGFPHPFLWVLLIAATIAHSAYNFYRIAQE